MSHHETAIWINQNPVDTRIIFNDFLKSYLGKSISDDVVDAALSNIVITDDPKSDSVYSFAKKADALGYLGRNGYDLTGIFYSFDSNPSLEAGN
jgi:NitT/TauT family transport system substrate-binding protein